MNDYIKQFLDKALTLASECWTRDWDENQEKIEEFKQFLEQSLIEAYEKGKETGFSDFGKSHVLQELIKIKIEQAIQAYKEELRAWIEKQTKKEIYVGETQYRNDKGNIAYVYNLALEDLINYLTK